MKLILRILLFTLCIQTSLKIHASEPTPYPSTILIKSPNETLSTDYVQLAITDLNATSISILQSVESITKLVRTRYFSLLNWENHTRTKDLEVENYARKKQFGRWINDPNDDVCYNTRAKVLVRDSMNAVAFRDNNHCVVDAGRWKDPYTTTTIKISKEVQIDHLVPLKNAYLSGAHKWSFRARCLYANYLGADFHLLSVNGIENMKKGDRAPDKYIPPNAAYTCTYLRNWLTVKMLWGLTMTTSEAESIRQAIRDHQCNPSSFRISEKELIKQRQFSKDNIDLCEKMDLAAKGVVTTQ